MGFNRIFNAMLGRTPVTHAQPGFDPKDEPGRESRKSWFGCFFWIVIIGLAISAFMFFRNRAKQKEIQANNAIATQVQATEDSYTATPSPTGSPTTTGTPVPSSTATPTITTTPATATPSPTATLTPAPRVVYRDRTVVITVEVPWVITQIVRETVVVVVTATPSPTPSPTTTTTTVTTTTTPTTTTTVTTTTTIEPTEYY